MIRHIPIINLFSTTDKARSMGTLVNNDTSNDTSSHFPGMVIDFEKETNSELLSWNYPPVVSVVVLGGVCW